MLIVLAICWIAGLLIADRLGVTTPLALGIVLTSLCLAALCWRRFRLRMLGLGLCLLFGACIRYNSAQLLETPASVWLLSGYEELSLQAAIIEDPKRTEDGQQLIVEVERARLNGKLRPAEGRVLVNLAPYPQYHYGQVLILKGELQQPRGPKRAGEFDYRRYLERKGIKVLMRDPAVRVLPQESGWAALRYLLAFRDHCRRVLLRLMPEPQSSLAIGILLGLQATIPDEVYNDFSVTGTSHILVISGWNFTILASLLASAAQRLKIPRTPTFWISLAVIWIYGLFVGATGTVLRAATMASLMLLATAAERESEPWTLLFGACFLLTIWNPNVLWDLGFQLSALATASLFAFAKPTEAWLEGFPPLRWSSLAWVKEALTATLAAQILALPPILYNFGNLSVIAPVANILIVPVIPFIMLWGSIALIGGLIWLPLGQVLAWMAWLLLAWMSQAASFLAQIPGAAYQIPPFPLWLLIGYYVIVIGGWLWISYLQPELETDDADE